MTRPMFLGIKLSKEENSALILWAQSEGLNKSTLARRVLHLAMRDAAAAQKFPAKLLTALNIQQAEINP